MMLLELLLYLTGAQAEAAGTCSHPLVETAWFPASGDAQQVPKGTLVLMNNGEAAVQAEARWPGGRIAVSLEAWEMKFIEV